VRILVCVKRVPMTGGKIVLSDDAQAIETKHLGFTISPHEECGVEEAVRLIEANGGESVVLTLGPSEAEEQLRDAMALGADRVSILKAVIGRGLALTAGGLLVGVAGSLALTRVMSSLLYQTSAHDPLAYLASVFLFTAAALLASYLPARKATRIDPCDALRAE